MIVGRTNAATPITAPQTSACLQDGREAKRVTHRQQEQDQEEQVQRFGQQLIAKEDRARVKRKGHRRYPGSTLIYERFGQEKQQKHRGGTDQALNNSDDGVVFPEDQVDHGIQRGCAGWQVSGQHLALPANLVRPKTVSLRQVPPGEAILGRIGRRSSRFAGDSQKQGIRDPDRQMRFPRSAAAPKVFASSRMSLLLGIELCLPGASVAISSARPIWPPGWRWH